MQFRGLIACLLIAAAALTGACRKAENKLAEELAERELAKQGVKADIDVDGQKMKIETKDGEQMEFASGDKGIEMPKDFPKEVHVYAGAMPMGSMKTKETQTLTLSTDDPLNKVAAVYQEKMKGSGWEETSALINAETAMLQYAKPTEEVIVNINPDGKKTQIVLVVQHKEKTE